MTGPLWKGIEEEALTGTRAGSGEGLATRIAAAQAGFSTEPDARVVEYATAPHQCLEELIEELMAGRRMLRRRLTDLGDYTVVSGAVLPLSGEAAFCMTDEGNPYYRFIRERYGASVVTAGTHINIGWDGSGANGDEGQSSPDALLRVCRVLRCEAALYLALTAASPFYRGEVTGFHSTRWRMFPRAPEEEIPLFADHASFAAWVELRLAAGLMWNTRHLWLSARPNGPGSPHHVSRVELRICDRIDDPGVLGALTELLEWRVQQILDDPELDPLVCSEIACNGLACSGMDTRRLTAAIDANENAVAESSLDAEVVDWRTGRVLPVRRWIEGFLDRCPSTSALAPLQKRLDEGTPAQQWLRRWAAGESIAEIVQATSAEESQRDLAWSRSLESERRVEESKKLV